MLIPCPVCGLRDHGEFTYGGDATIVRPNIGEGDAERWAAYVYDRQNPCGVHDEYWQHTHGCRQFMIVTRNTQTHDVSASRLVGRWAGRGSS
jgi:sarcosine oxidase subunit delta